MFIGDTVEMDVLAHGLWTYAAFSKRKDAVKGVLFGIMPDIMPFGSFLLMSMLTNNISNWNAHIGRVPQWVIYSYNLTHSLFIFIFSFILLRLIIKKWYVPMAGWAFHIALDIPTHTGESIATPFLWPVSEYRFNGISWSEPVFMMVNYTALITVFVYIFYSASKTKKKYSEKRFFQN